MEQHHMNLCGESIGDMAMHSLEIDYRRLWRRQNYDVTESQGAARSVLIVCSKIQFSNQNINVIKKAEIILKKTSKNVMFHCLNKQWISVSLILDFGRQISW